MQTGFTISSQCDEKEFLDVVRLNGLLKYNLTKTFGKLKEPDIEIVKVARNHEGIIIGGVSGTTYLSSLEIEVLWVSEDYRGQNIASRLLAEVESEARDVGCHLAHLTTYSFQAPEFYLKQGYVICGEITGFPDDIILYMLKKQM